MLDAHIPLVFNNIATEKEESRRVDRCLAFRQNKAKQNTTNHPKTQQNSPGRDDSLCQLLRVSTTDLAGQWLSDMAQVVESVSRIALCQFSTGHF